MSVNDTNLDVSPTQRTSSLFENPHVNGFLRHIANENKHDVGQHFGTGKISKRGEKVQPKRTANIVFSDPVSGDPYSRRKAKTNVLLCTR